MIIKIERHQDNQEYWLLDGISKITVSERLSIGESNEPWAYYDIMIYDHLNGNTLEGYSASIYQLLICRLKSGEEISIGFDTICYIMNDNGQIIEKLRLHMKSIKDPHKLILGDTRNS